MGRILTKAWNIENSEEFQEYLRNVGDKLDNGAYKGREGWHKFASDLGNVYNNHSNSKKSKENLKLVQNYLGQVDLELVTISASSSKKRKADKLTLTQREELELMELQNFIEKNGGSRDQVVEYRVRMKLPNHIEYFSPQGRLFKTKKEVAKYLKLKLTSSSNKPNTASSGNKYSTGMKKSSSNVNQEKKKLQKELDKLFREQRKLLLQEKELQTTAIHNTPNIQSTFSIVKWEGICSEYIPHVLESWDFLCMFSKTLHLDPISLEDYVLNLKSEEDHCIYLAEAHIALMKLLLQDRSSDDWWFCDTDANKSIMDLFISNCKPNSFLLTAHTWPCLLGATSFRILQYFKSVDTLDLDPIQVPIEHLTSGKNYYTLTPVQRVMLIKVLMEAAYDTHRLFTTIEEKAKTRLVVEKALLKQKARLEKNTKNEASKLESLAKKKFPLKNLGDAITQIKEEAAFETDCLLILTKEEYHLKFPNSTNLDNLTQACSSLKQVLKDDKRTLQRLKAAIKKASTSLKYVHHEEVNVVDVLRDAVMDLNELEKLQEKNNSLFNLSQKLDLNFVRTEVVGEDVVSNKYWLFKHQKNKVWIELHDQQQSQWACEDGFMLLNQLEQNQEVALKKSLEEEKVSKSCEKEEGEYYNSLGKFCGRKVDAPYSASPLYFSKLILKKEAEYYTRFKSSQIAFFQNRNDWIVTLKQNGHLFDTCKQSLLELENALGELSGDANTDSNTSTNKDNNNFRHVQLESSVIGRIWNSSDAKIVFHDIISGNFFLNFQIPCFIF